MASQSTPSQPNRMASRAHPYPRPTTAHGGHSRSSSVNSANSAPLRPLSSLSVNPTGTIPMIVDQSVDTLWVDEVAARLQLDDESTSAAHEFANLSMQTMLMTLYMQSLQRDQLAARSLAPLAQISISLTRIENLCRSSWEPSDAQVKLLKQLLRHYTIKPIASYRNIQTFVRDYIIQHADKLKLQIYIKDPLVKRKVNEMLTKDANEIKSQFRKSVFNSVINRLSLAEFATQMVPAYHMPQQPNPIPDTILATLALHREIARPRVGKKTGRGGDTGHWTAIETRLEAAYSEHGNQRGTSPGWLSWQEDLIAADDEEYEQAECDPDQEEEELNYNDDTEYTNNPDYNGDVDLSNMGNMAQDD